mmetsp:Transcript_49336/g.125316  ORF Transcript_49336/g.125316 Transcript_49336/m.125316 type:complete len:220 (+) Transcript_49336:214-873(+)
MPSRELEAHELLVPRDQCLRLGLQRLLFRHHGAQVLHLLLDGGDEVASSLGGSVDLRNGSLDVVGQEDLASQDHVQGEGAAFGFDDLSIDARKELGGRLKVLVDDGHLRDRVFFPLRQLLLPLPGQDLRLGDVDQLPQHRELLVFDAVFVLVALRLFDGGQPRRLKFEVILLSTEQDDVVLQQQSIIVGIVLLEEFLLSLRLRNRCLPLRLRLQPAQRR